MALDLTSFRARFPEYSVVADYPDAYVQVFIDDAIEDVNQTKFKETIADRITAYLAAHYLTIAELSKAGNQGTVAPVASQSVGEVSVSYAVANLDKGSSAYYKATVYGQQYLALLKRYCVGMISING